MNLTEKQTELIRHALGFDQGVKKSYRNRYHATPGGPAFQEWDSMVAAGAAQRAAHWTDNKGNAPALVEFFVTPAGARAVLRPGESLCREDFPFQEGAG